MVAGAYRSVQTRIAELAADADPTTRVPACPDWDIRQLLSHLTGLAGDVVDGNLYGYGGDRWTSQQVAARDGADVNDLLVEWAEHTSELDTILEHPLSAGLGEAFDSAAAGTQPIATLPGAILGDAVIHEHDLRGALGNADARTSSEMIGALDGMIRGVRRTFPRSRLPTLRVVATDVGMEWLMGLDVPAAELRATAYELFRSVSGRRTKDEMRSLAWDGDPEPFLDHIVWPFFASPAESLGER